MVTSRPINPASYLVEFKPDAKHTNATIGALMELVQHMPPEQFAKMIASEIAAVAFVLYRNNTKETIKGIFEACIDDAAQQFERRAKMVSPDTGNKLNG